jgi:hypothetical protein
MLGTRDVLANLETGRRREVSIDELLLRFAYASMKRPFRCVCPA